MRKSAGGGPRIYDIQLSIEMYKTPKVKNASGYNVSYMFLNDLFYSVPQTFKREWEVEQILNYEPSAEESEVPDKSLIFCNCVEIIKLIIHLLFVII
jgi:hypothetical protein